MIKYLLAFHGGSMPDKPEELEAIMQQWGTWMESLGEAIVDPGSILGQAHTVRANKTVEGGGADPLSGYMIIRADDKAAALKIADGCPILKNQGSIEVATFMNP